jgi:hypothetical protein
MRRAMSSAVPVVDEVEPELVILVQLVAEPTTPDQFTSVSASGHPV